MNPITVLRTQPKTVLLTIGSCLRHGLSPEQELEQQCFKLLGKDEMARNGSRWRCRIRDHPGRMSRVLADLRAAQKEGIGVRNPGAWAEKCWRTFR